MGKRSLRASLVAAEGRMSRFRILIALPALAATAVAASPLLSSKRGHERVVLASSPDPVDPKIAAQQRILRDWRQGAADRDVAFVTVAGSHVEGASDSAAALRKRFRLARGTFEAVLIGKDGHLAMRSGQPLTAEALQGAIDAMPMRRNGER